MTAGSNQRLYRYTFRSDKGASLRDEHESVYAARFLLHESALPDRG